LLEIYSFICLNNVTVQSEKHTEAKDSLANLSFESSLFFLYEKKFSLRKIGKWTSHNKIVKIILT
jgi:hypothetical protein